MTKGTSRAFGVSDFVIPSGFGIRASSFGAMGAFTLIELLVVITVIIVLAGLILSTIGYVQKKGARARAETEIAAISAACESYKADNGIYPRSSAETDVLNPSSTDPTTYQTASLKLYEFLSGDSNHDRMADTKSYFTFKPNQLIPTDQTQNVVALRDPFGNSYGYSTAKASGAAFGYNPTFDLWSTAGGTQASDVPGWIKNW